MSLFRQRHASRRLAVLLLSGAQAGCAFPGAPPATPAAFGIGQPASVADIARLDIDVMPDGTGLPPGGATAREGEPLYAARCAACHGATGTEGPNDRLAGRLPDDAFPFGASPGEKRTVGNYWPHATTLFDYIRRAMPVDRPGSLTGAEVYAVTAHVLYLNALIGRDEVMNAQTLPQVRMPASARYVHDQRRGGAGEIL